jgi:putative transposase
MAAHLGAAKNDTDANPAGKARNGKKTLKDDFGELPIEIPRDRHGCFELQIVVTHQTRWAGFEEKILSLYARGLTVREIQSHLEKMYGAEVSPTLISWVTDAAIDEAKAWQARPLDELYPIVYLDCIHIKTRDAGAVRAKAVYLALVISMEGEKEILGLWIPPTEGAKFWLRWSPSSRIEVCRAFLLPAWMALKAFPMQLKPCTLRPRFSFASCTR